MLGYEAKLQFGNIQQVECRCELNIDVPKAGKLKVKPSPGGHWAIWGCRQEGTSEALVKESDHGRWNCGKSSHASHTHRSRREGQVSQKHLGF